MNEIMSFAATEMDLKMIILSEVSNPEKDMVFAARWRLLGPLDCSLPSLADLLLTSAESWLLGAC